MDTDESLDGVQPDEGQGDGGSGGNPAYAEYLERIPEDARGVAEEAFQAWDKNYQQHTTEASDYRKSWEPYEQLGVNQFDPGVVQEALQFRQAIAENPQGVWEWAQQYAQQHGLTPQEAVDQLQQQDEFGQFNEQQQQQQMQQLLQQQLSPLQQQLGEFAQWRQSLEQQAHQSQITDALKVEMDALKSKHADTLPAEIRDQFEEIIGLHGMKYAEAGSDPKQVVERAWADFQGIYNQIEKAALQSKVGAPAPAEGGGVPDVSPEKATTFKQAEVAAAEFLRSNRG